MMHSPVWGRVDVLVTMPPTLATQATVAFAARWAVAPADVRIDWPDAQDAASPASAVDSLAIAGDGARGRFVLELFRAGGEVRRMWVRAGVVAQAPLAAVDLPRGVTIDSTHVERAAAVVWGGPAHREDHDVIGWVTRRAIAAGEPLEEPTVVPPAAVTAGTDVRVIVRRGAIELSLPGRALSTASAGERVTVRLATGRRMSGIAGSGGTVVVSNTTEIER